MARTIPTTSFATTTCCGIAPSAPSVRDSRAAAAVAPLRAAAEAKGSPDFSVLWSGQAASLSRELGAFELTRSLAPAALEIARNLEEELGAWV